MPRLVQGRLELAGRTLEGRVPAAEVGHDGAGAAEGILEVAGQPAVVDRCRVEAVAGHQQGEAAAHAEPDHAGLAGGQRRIGQPGPGRGEVRERAARFPLSMLRMVLTRQRRVPPSLNRSSASVR